MSFFNQNFTDDGYLQKLLAAYQPMEFFLPCWS